MNTIYLFIINNILNIQLQTKTETRQLATFPLPLISQDGLDIFTIFREVKYKIPNVCISYSIEVANHHDRLLQRIIDPDVLKILDPATTYIYK